VEQVEIVRRIEDAFARIDRTAAKAARTEMVEAVEEDTA
jgi:hypothetical protein